MAAGFEQKGRKFARHGEYVGSDLWVERRSDFYSGLLRISVQAWVCVKGVAYLLGEDEDNLEHFMSPIIAVYQFPDFGQMPGPPVPHIEFDTLRAGETDADVDAKIAAHRTLIADHFLPWLDRFKTPEDVGDYLIDPEPGVGRTRIGYRDPRHPYHDLARAAACFVVAGNPEKAQAALELMKSAKKGVPKEYEPTRQKHIASIKRHIARLRAN